MRNPIKIYLWCFNIFSARSILISLTKVNPSNGGIGRRLKTISIIFTNENFIKNQENGIRYPLLLKLLKRLLIHISENFPIKRSIISPIIVKNRLLNGPAIATLNSPTLWFL